MNYVLTETFVVSLAFGFSKKAATSSEISKVQSVFLLVMFFSFKKFHKYHVWIKRYCEFNLCHISHHSSALEG